MNQEWYNENYGFFGLFYHIGDHSDTGFDANRKMTRDERTLREISYIKKYLSPKYGDKILDCPCGDGRHSIKLANHGFNVIGVDLNESMLSLSNLWNTKSSINNPVFKKMDMRNLAISSESMDFVINMFISFGFFETDDENESVVKEFYKVLKPGGKLLIHLDLNYDNVINNRFHGMEHIFRECYFDSYVRTLEIDERYNPITKRLEGSWTLINGDSHTKHYSIRIYDNENEFIPLFKKNGFKHVVVLDPLTGKAANRNSVETILIAEK